MGSRHSRRTFLKTSLIGSTACVGKLLPFFSPGRPSAIVVGAGAFGGWSALHLAERGAKVTLLDAWGPGNSRSSSGGETRTIRATYGPAQSLYVRMDARGLRLWQDYEQKWGTKLFFRSGALRMAAGDGAYEGAALPVLEQAGIRYEKLSVAESTKRWPQINFEGVAWSILEPESGFLAARRGCEAVFHAFLRAGGEYRQVQVSLGAISANRMNGIRLGSGEVLTADIYVFAPGPWLGSLFPFLNAKITPTRQEVFFFGTPAGDARFDEEHIPTWIDGGKQPFFGVPGNHWRGFKIADDTRGPVINPTVMERQVSPAKLDAARAYLRLRFPSLGTVPLLEARVCQYENSTDHNFILDRHPEASNVWIIGGGSGHGFKHGPVMGEMLAAAVLETSPAPVEMSLGRATLRS